MIVWNGIKVDISVRECVWKCWFIYDCEWFSYRDWGCLLFCWVVILFCFILSFMLVYIIVEEMNLLSVEFVLVI